MSTENTMMVRQNKSSDFQRKRVQALRIQWEMAYFRVRISLKALLDWARYTREESVALLADSLVSQDALKKRMLGKADQLLFSPKPSLGEVAWLKIAAATMQSLSWCVYGFLRVIFRADSTVLPSAKVTIGAISPSSEQLLQQRGQLRQRYRDSGGMLRRRKSPPGSATPEQFLLPLVKYHKKPQAPYTSFPTPRLTQSPAKSPKKTATVATVATVDRAEALQYATKRVGKKSVLTLENKDYVPGQAPLDGNCFFHTMVQLLGEFGTHTTHDKLRADVVEFMRTHRNEEADMHRGLAYVDRLTVDLDEIDGEIAALGEALDNLEGRASASDVHDLTTRLEDAIKQRQQCEDNLVAAQDLDIAGQANAYLNLMAQDTVWVDHLVVLGAARYLRVNIALVSKVEAGQLHEQGVTERVEIYRPKSRDLKEHKGPLRTVPVYFVGGNHYVPGMRYKKPKVKKRKTSQAKDMVAAGKFKSPRRNVIFATPQKKKGYAATGRSPLRLQEATYC